VALDVRAQAVHAGAVLAFRLGDYDGATAAGNASLALYRELGDRRGIAGALNYLAGVEFELGHVDRAVELCEESLALRRQVGSPDDVVCSLRNLAMLMFERADRRASDLLEESVSILRVTRQGPSLVWSLNLLADIALGEGRLTAARAYLDECVGTIAGDRHPVLMSEVHNTRGHLARAEGDPAGAAASYREALRIQLPFGHRGKAAYDIQGLAAVAWMEGRAERAAVLYAAAAAAMTASGHHAERHEREKHDAVLADVREALGVEAFRAAWAAGGRLEFDEAVALALDGD
jgi:tetratricopeptide (TPR) repeat protein